MFLLKFIFNQQNTEQMDDKMENVSYKVLFACPVVWHESIKWECLQDLEKAKLLNFFYQAACG